MKKTFLIIAAITCAAVFTACGSSNDGGAAKASGFISADDVPEGWASYTGSKDLAGGANAAPDAAKGTAGGAGAQNVITVSTRDELKAALTKGRSRIIYVKGIIDITDTGSGTLIPSTVDGTTSGLDAFVKENTAGSVLPAENYKDWKIKYTKTFNYTEDQYGPVGDLRNELNNKWRELITLNLKDNTTIIGLDENSGIRGGSWNIKGNKNIVIRNLTISDCYNPFPAIEDSDGLNALFDCISIQKSKYIWIDHCTIFSTYSREQIEKDKYETKDRRDVKWQVYDGLLDITNTNDFVTVSWCILRNHDKTMLIGNSDKKTEDKNHQTITLHHNWYDSCKQRLPFVRFATIHIYNNLYTNQTGTGIDRRKDCRIYSENNCFEEAARSVTPNTNGTMYDTGSLNIKTDNLTKTPEWKPSDYYKYKAEPAKTVRNSVMAGAGAGKLPVKM